MAVIVMYSPSTRRVCAAIGPGICGTLVLNENFEVDPNPIHAAPIDPRTMSESFSNERITDWQEHKIELWTDLKSE